MNTASDDASRPAPADYEKVLASAQSEAAHFDEDRPTLLRRVQTFLHAYPTMVPFLVLLIGILAFTVPLPRFVEVEIQATVEGQAPVIETQLQFVALAGDRFFAPFNLSLIVQQVTIIGILGIAQTLVILTAGIDLSVGVIMILCSVVMGRTAVVYGVPLEIAFPLGLLVGLLCGCGQRTDHHATEAAALHRHARHMEHLRGAQHLLFRATRPSVNRTSRRVRLSCNGPARSSNLTI